MRFICFFSRKEKGTLKVFSEYDVLSQFLTDKRFELVAVQADADILWYNRHFYDFLYVSSLGNNYLECVPEFVE